jgi:hypothetical protein
MDVISTIQSIKKSHDMVNEYRVKIINHRKKVDEDDDFIRDCENEIKKLQNLIKMEEWEISTEHNIPSDIEYYSPEEVNKQLHEMKLDKIHIELWNQ